MEKWDCRRRHGGCNLNWLRGPLCSGFRPIRGPERVVVIHTRERAVRHGPPTDGGAGAAYPLTGSVSAGLADRGLSGEFGLPELPIRQYLAPGRACRGLEASVAATGHGQRERKKSL